MPRKKYPPHIRAVATFRTQDKHEKVIDSPVPTRELTLQEEARETTRKDHSLWSQDARLRQRPMSFVSSGYTEPLKNCEVQVAHNAADAAKNITDFDLQRCLTIANTTESTDSAAVNNDEIEQRDRAKVCEDKFLGDNNRHNARPGIDVGSDDEVLLFKGRKHVSPVEFTDNNACESVDIISGLERVHIVSDSNAQDSENLQMVSNMIVPYISEIGQLVSSGNSRADKPELGRSPMLQESMDADDCDLSCLRQRDLDMDCDSDLNPAASCAEGAYIGVVDSTDDWEAVPDQPTGAEMTSRPSTDRATGVGIEAEMEAALRAAHERDRKKRADKKRQREELRALGVLDKKGFVGNLLMKNHSGITVDHIVAEIRSFLSANEGSITFPPLDPRKRKIVHLLAYAFNLKSKSIDKDDRRRPVLIKTLKTLVVTDEDYDRIVAHSLRRLYNNADVRKSKWGIKYYSVRRGAGNNRITTTLNDGEIVGATLPELGEDNKGRAILEKMGWRRGTALGAHENKGILVPVVQVIKKTKAGLGVGKLKTNPYDHRADSKHDESSE